MSYLYSMYFNNLIYIFILLKLWKYLITEPTNIRDPKTPSIEDPLSILFTLHQQTNQLMEQLMVEIWLLQPVEEFAQLPAKITQDKAEVHDRLESLITRVDQDAQISTKLIPELLAAIIPEALKKARAILAPGSWDERKPFCKMLKQLSLGNFKALNQAKIKSVSWEQYDISVPFNNIFNNINREISRNVKKADKDVS
jgi:hypothetical protein